jgi:hypothetical protein
MGLGMFLGQKPQTVESTKIVFNDKEVTGSYEKGFIGFLDSLKTSSDRASFFGLYINNVITSLIANNNWIINKVFGFMNKYLSESIIILLFPIIASLFIVGMIFINFCLSFFYLIKNWADFFMNKTVKNNKVTWNEPFTYLRPWRWFLFILYCFFLFFPIVSMLPLLITFYSILSPLGINAKIYKTDIVIGFTTFIRDVILYKSQLYLILFTIALTASSPSFKNFPSSV